MVRIAADENLHMVFYRDILAAAIELQPSAAVRAIVDEVLAFEMPGAGIPGFMRKAAAIAKAGIYDIRDPSRRGPDADPPALADLRADRSRCRGRGRPRDASSSIWRPSRRAPSGSRSKLAAAGVQRLTLRRLTLRRTGPPARLRRCPGYP